MTRKATKRNNNQLRAPHSLPVLFLFLILSLIFISVEGGKKGYIRVFFPNGFSVTAELARTEEERALGLMFREKINEDQGMLFIFEKGGIYPFWMKNMKFSIDILWLDKEKRIIHLEENVPPCLKEPCPTYSSQLPATYVLELKAGSVAKNQLKLLDKLEFIIPSN